MTRDVEERAVRREFRQCCIDDGEGVAYATDFLQALDEREGGRIAACPRATELSLDLMDPSDLGLACARLPLLLRQHLVVADCASISVAAVGLDKPSYGHAGFVGTIAELLEQAQSDIEAARGSYPAHLQPQFDRFYSTIALLLNPATLATSAVTFSSAVTVVIRDPSGLSSFRFEHGTMVPEIESAFARSVVKRTWPEMEELALIPDRAEEDAPLMNPPVEVVAEWVRAAKYVAVMTGAGASYEAGIPTFRTSVSANDKAAQDESASNGAAVGAAIWTAFDPRDMTQSRFNQTPAQPTEDEASSGAAYWWKMKRSLWGKFQAAAPTATHKFFAMLPPGKCAGVVTQNIDSLHKLACEGADNGIPYVELHGHMRRVICSDFCTPLNPVPFRSGTCTYSTTPSDELMTASDPCVPRCPECVSPLRFETVMFDQPLPQGSFREAELIMERADLVFVVGTSLIVKPASLLPGCALASGAHVVMVNMHPTQYDDYARAVVREPAGSFFQRLAVACGFVAPEASP